MRKRPPLNSTLHRTSDKLKSIRREIAVDGYIEEMQEIDALVAVAQIETERKLSAAPVDAPESARADTPWKDD